MTPSTATSRQTQPAAGEPSRGPLDWIWLLMMLPPLFWAGNSVLARALVGVVPPIGLAFWRWVVGAAILLPFAWPHLRRDWPIMRARPGVMLLLSALGIGAFNTLLYLGLQTTTALNGVMIQSTTPVLVAALSVFVFRERLTGLQWAGILLSMAGAAVLVGQGQIRTFMELAFNRGDLWVVVAAIAYAGYTLLLRRRPTVHGLSFVVATFLIGATLLLPFYLWETVAGRPMPLSLPALGGVAYTAICASVLAYLCFNRAVALAGPSVAGLSIHLVPVFGSLLAIAVLGESAHWYHAVGIGLIAAGVVLATRKVRGQRSQNG